MRLPAARRPRLIAVLASAALAAGVLAATSPAAAAISTPGNGATVSGNVPITEARGSTNTCIARDDSSSRLRVLNEAGAVVHSASRDDAGALSTTWSSVGRPNGTYRIQSFARDSVRSGFLNLGCTTRAESQLSNTTVTLDNRAAVTLTAPVEVVTGESLEVAVLTTVQGTGISSTPAADRDVTVTVPGVGDTGVRTDSAGRGSVTFDLPDLPVGALEINATVASDATLRGLFDSTSTTLLPRSSGLEYTGDTRAQPGAAAALGARLVDTTPDSDRAGTPLEGEDVALRFGDSDGSGVTDADGVAERSVVVRGGSRTEAVEARFAGTDVYSGSDDEVTFYVGDAAAQEAAVEHDVLGGVVRGLTTLIGDLLAPVTRAVDELAVQEPVASILDPIDALVAALGIPPRTGSVWDVADLDLALDTVLQTTTAGLVKLADDTDVVIDDLLENASLGEDLDALVDVTRFRWRSVVEVDGESTAREFKATLGVPQPLDVTGDGRPDVLANLTLASDFASVRTGGVDGDVSVDADLSADPLTIVPRLEIARLSSAPEELPLSLQALVALPGSSDEFRFGYDSRDGEAPEGFQADLVLGDGEVGVELASRSDSPLTLSGAVVPAGASGEEDADLAPREQRFGIAFDRAPTAARAAVRLDGGQEDVAAQLATDAATRVDISFADDSGGDEVTLADVTLDAVDGTAGVEVTGDGGDGVGATIRSAAGLDRVLVDGRQLDGGRTVNAVRLALADVPDTVDFSLGADGTGSLDASAPIGVFEAGYATGGSIATLEDDAYLRLLQGEQERSSVAVRLPGFEQMALGLGDDLSVDLTKQAGPLRLLAELDDLTFAGRVEDTPREIALGVDQSGGVSVAGSDAIAAVDLQASSSDPEGLFQGAEQVDVRLRDVPQSLTVTAGDDGVVFDAAGQPIGLVELDAHSGAPVTIPGGGDGLVLDQSGGSTTLAARIQGLRTIEAEIDETPELLLDTVARQVFSVAILGDSPDEAIRATLDRLVPQMRLALVDDGSGSTSLSYRASEATESLEFTLAGLSGSISGPLPAELDICMADGSSCLPDAGIADPELGSITFEAGEYTTLNLADPSGELTVEDLRLRRLDLTGSIGEDGGPLYLNTTSFDGSCGFAGCEYPLRGGRVLSNLGDASLTFTPGDGFSAVDAVTELEVTELFGVPTGLRGRSGTGIVRCVGATALRVELEIIGIPISVNLRDAVCNVSRPPRTQ
ncbi:hypothetical protein ACHAAC_00185 [Aeromicrobium sp. CF4.19]|uniref:hypothetical protein n=1 Tax=Aeromicrobium sp. CF4.19 TaxID=3373082 RepID=UPI003EE53E0E